MYQGIFRWEKNINRLRFDRIMVMSLWPAFVAHSVENSTSQYGLIGPCPVSVGDEDCTQSKLHFLLESFFRGGVKSLIWLATESFGRPVQLYTKSALRKIFGLCYTTCVRIGQRQAKLKYYTHTRLTAFFRDYPVASAGPYASLHLAPDR